MDLSPILMGFQSGNFPLWNLWFLPVTPPGQNPNELYRIIVEIYGKIVEKLWKNDGKIYGKIEGKVMGKCWKNCGKIMERLWKIMGKLWEINGKNYGKIMEML